MTTDTLTKKLMEELLARFSLDSPCYLHKERIFATDGSLSDNLKQLFIDYFGSEEVAKAIKTYYATFSGEDIDRILVRRRELECLLDKK